MLGREGEEEEEEEEIEEEEEGCFNDVTVTEGCELEPVCSPSQLWGLGVDHSSMPLRAMLKQHTWVQRVESRRFRRDASRLLPYLYSSPSTIFSC